MSMYFGMLRWKGQENNSGHEDTGDGNNNKKKYRQSER